MKTGKVYIWTYIILARQLFWRPRFEIYVLQISKYRPHLHVKCRARVQLFRLSVARVKFLMVIILLFGRPAGSICLYLYTGCVAIVVGIHNNNIIRCDHTRSILYYYNNISLSFARMCLVYPIMFSVKYLITIFIVPKSFSNSLWLPRENSE